MTSEPATRSRYVVLFFLCSMSLVLYLDRVCLGQATTDIKADLGLNDDLMKWVHMAFSLAYGIFEVPVGRWGDRFGPRYTLARIVFVWSIFTALTGASWSFWSLLAIRFLFGLGEAGAYPNAARITTSWFPLRERGRYRAFLIACSYLGGAIAPTLAAALIKEIGWRWNFVVFGAFGIVWAAAFFWWFRDTPAEHPSVNAAERELIGPPSTGMASHHDPIPWGYILRSRNVLCLSMVIICSSFLTYFFFSWYSDYLRSSRGVESQWAGYLSSTVLTGSTFGVLLGGFVNDRLRTPTSRKWFCAGSTALGAFVFLLGTQTESPLEMSILFGLCSMSLLCMQPVWWSFTAEVSGVHLGSIFGFMNGAGTIGAMGSQYYFGTVRQALLDQGYEGREAADPAFWLYFFVILGAAVSWASLDTRQMRGEGLETPRKIA